MRTPTIEQRDVLEDSSRIRVVRAAPGSGKTWLVAEVLRRELLTWPTRTGGIAALSFTRVAGEEIRRAVGHDLNHPHFVGTIDSFLFRYVLRPYLRECFPWFASPRLIPAAFGADTWRSFGQGQSTEVGRGINVFGCLFVGEQSGKAVMARKPHPALPLRPIDGEELDRVKKRKKAMWEKSGLLTHSDAAFWASKVLEDEPLATVACNELLRRFPLLIVDELQDTGYFLSKSLRLLLQRAQSRALLVGDPDQAIFEFTGARPDLFSTFEALDGATTLPLTQSQRCPAAAASAAVHLKDSPGTIQSADRHGRAVLVHYQDMITNLGVLSQGLSVAYAGFAVKVVARHTATIAELAGRLARPVPKLGCGPLNHLHRAVAHFRQGRQGEALAASRAALDVALRGHEGSSDDDLAQNGIDPRIWTLLALRCLLAANAADFTGSLYDWQERIGHLFDAEIERSMLDVAGEYVAGKLKPRRQKKGRKGRPDPGASPCTEFIPNAGVPGSRLPVRVETVHAVKGESHDVTLFVCPDPAKPDRCPSVLWWSTNDRDREEKRIAYVALTRSRGDLILAVSDACYERLRRIQPQFIATFEPMSVDECLRALPLTGFNTPNTCDNR